jgi:hypothetical protein
MRSFQRSRRLSPLPLSPHTGWQVTSEIRVFAEDEILTEITETEAVTALTPIQDGR